MAHVSPIFNRNRTLKIAARMDRLDDGSQPAFHAMTQLLAAKGASWECLINDWLASQATPAQEHIPALSRECDLANWLSNIDAAIAQSAKNEQTVSQAGGAGVPSTVSGIIEKITERTTRKGEPMLVVTLENASASYHGIVVFDRALIDRIRNGSALSGTATLQKPARAHLGPILVEFTDVRD